MLFTAQVGNLFTSGRSSREVYLEIFMTQFVTFSRVELPIAKNPQKFFFSKFSFYCSSGQSWQLACDLSQLRKSCVLGKLVQFLILFSFPSNISDCSSSFFPDTLSKSLCLSRTSFVLALFHHSIFKERFGSCLLLIVFHIYYIFILDCVFF